MSGDVILFSTAKITLEIKLGGYILSTTISCQLTPSEVWIPIAVEPSLIASIAYSTWTQISRRKNLNQHNIATTRCFLAVPPLKVVLESLCKC